MADANGDLPASAELDASIAAARLDRAASPRTAHCPCFPLTPTIPELSWGLTHLNQSTRVCTPSVHATASAWSRCRKSSAVDRQSSITAPHRLKSD